MAELRRLQRRAGRVAQQRFLVEGPQAVRESLRRRGADGPGSGALDLLWCTEDGAGRHGELVAAAHAAGVEVVTVSEPVLAAVAETVTPQGLVGIAPLLAADLADVLTARPRLLAVLSETQDPGNAGTVIRAADAAGAAAVVLAGDAVDPHNGKCVRASAGSIFHLPVVTGLAVPDVIDRLTSAGIAVLAMDGDADEDLFSLADAGDLAGPTALLLGNEAHGLAEAVRRRADRQVRLPLLGAAESLNLAMAATVALYTVARAQRDDPRL